MNKIDQQTFYVRSILILNQNIKIWGNLTKCQISQNHQKNPLTALNASKQCLLTENIEGNS